MVTDKLITQLEATGNVVYTITDIQRAVTSGVADIITASALVNMAHGCCLRSKMVVTEISKSWLLSNVSNSSLKRSTTIPHFAVMLTDKRVAILYFKGPGQNALVAEGMKVAPSIYNLVRLRNEG